MPVCGYDPIVLVAALVVAIVVVVALAVLPVGYNLVGPRLEGHQRRRDDRSFIDHGSRNHRVNRRLPADPRCKLCYVPFGGVGRVLGIRPSRKNSNFCRACFEAAPAGGHETDIGVLFADARGFTAWSARESPTVVATALNRFYRGAMTALMAHDALIDKFVGDEVMAIFIAGLPSLGATTCDQMLAAAMELMAAARTSFIELPIGVGLHRGTAWVGNVGDDDVKDFTAIGDVVNVASRLLSCAGPGEIVMSDEVYLGLTAPPPSLARTFAVKGKDEAVRAHVMTPAAAVTR